MPKTIALLFEYKSDGLPGKSGPGDVLRLAHALRHPNYAHTSIKLLTTVDPSCLSQLFANPETIYIQPTKKAEVGDLNKEHLASILDRHFQETLDGASVIHVFIGEEEFQLDKEPCTSTTGHSFGRQRIDRTRMSGLMMHSRWQNEIAPSKGDRWLAAAIRKLPSYPTRNSPPWYVELVRQIAKDEGYRIAWFGDADEFQPLNNERRLSHQGLSFVQQIERFRKESTCAVGWNSGGLDLAAAAGIPILRVGEFQGSCVPEDDGHAPPDRKWGARYNWFLSVATTVGLTPRVLNAEKFDQVVLRDSLRSFLRNQRHLQQSRHIILPLGERLIMNESDLRTQLAESAS